MRYREIEESDVATLLALRSETDENNISRQRLLELNITEQSVSAKLRSGYKGWLCEIGVEIVGFAIGDSTTGELWVIAVHPDHIKKGIGSVLMNYVEEWLFGCNCEKLWLTTDMNTELRAYSFYRKRGWEDDYLQDHLRYMKKLKIS